MNYLAILAAAVIYILIGSLWYSPLLFAKKWKKLNNINSKEVKNKTGWEIYIMPLVSAFITSFMMSWIINMLWVTQWVGGAMIGLFCWFGFTASTQLLNWSFSGKKMGAFLIDTGYQFISFILMGTILAQWR